MKKLPKPRPKSETQANHEELNDARGGRCATSCSIALRDHLRDPGLPGLPEEKYVFVREFVTALNSAVRILESMHLGVESRTALGRSVAEQVILSALVLRASADTLDGVTPAQKMVDERMRKFVVAAAKLEKLNKKLLTTDTNFEEFKADYDELGMSDEFSVLIGVSAKEVDAKLVSNHGTIDLRKCRREITHLPSKHLHRFYARITDITLAQAGFTRIKLLRLDVIEPKTSAVGEFHQLVCNFDNKMLKNAFLIAALHEATVEISANAMRIPLLRSSDDLLEVDVVSCTPLLAATSSDGAEAFSMGFLQ